MRRLLSISGTELPEGSLLAAKVLALAWLVPGHALHTPGVFLPFVPWLDAWRDTSLFPAALSLLGTVAALSILFKLSPRAACLILAATVLTSCLASRLYFSNNRLFFAALLLMLGLQRRGESPWLVRLQLSVLYLGAGLDKLLDEGWRSGRFFAGFASRLTEFGSLWSPGGHTGEPVPLAAAFQALAAGGALGTALPWVASWAVIGVELFLALAFSLGWMKPALTLHLGLQCSIVLFTGSTMGVFFPSCLAAVLVFLPWRERLEVHLGAGAPLHGLCAAALRHLEPDSRFSLTLHPSPRALEVTTTREGTTSGWHGAALLTRELGATYLLGVTLLSAAVLPPWLCVSLIGALGLASSGPPSAPGRTAGAHRTAE